MEKAVILKKQEEVTKATKKFSDAKVVIAFDYQGLTVEQFTALRRSLRASGSEVMVLKNNISRRASKEAGFGAFAEELKGPKALAINYTDPVAPAKGLNQFAKTNDKVVLGGGIVEGQVVSKAKILELATLPSYETLLTQLAAGMLGTLMQLAVGLNMIATKEEE